MKKSNLLALALTTAAASSFGAGFSLFQGDTTGCADAAGSIAKGGRAGDLYYNPATMSSVTGTVVQTGSFFTRPHLKIEGTDPYTGTKHRAAGKKEWFAIPHLYLTSQVADDLWVGVGLFSRMGLGDQFPDGWFGRYNSTEVDIVTFDVAPTLAWRATDWLTIGAGVTLQYFGIVLEQDIDAAGVAGMRPYNAPYPDSPLDVHQNIHGRDDLAVGWDLGVKIDPIERLHLGLAYHSKVEVRAKGHARYDVPAPVKAAYPAFFGDTKIKGGIDEPDYWMGAVVYDFTDRLSLGVNVTRTGWSSWDELVIEQEKAFLPGHGELRSVKDWNDVWRFSVGGSYKLDENWTALASYTWDDSPINRKHADYLVPADTREIYALGLSWEDGPWAIDGMYFFEKINDCSFGGRPQEGILEGKYTGGFSHAFALSASYRF